MKFHDRQVFFDSINDICAMANGCTDDIFFLMQLILVRGIHLIDVENLRERSKRL